jgi:CopG antitoxin of type II toxin-antitoxin system
MARSKKQRDSIPEHFTSIEDAAEFWDSHDLGDYWDLTREAEFEVNVQRRVFLTALEPELAKRLTESARKQGVSAETLINVWLSEKLAESVQSGREG